MSGGEDEILCDEGPATKVSSLELERHQPGVGVDGRFRAVNDFGQAAAAWLRGAELGAEKHLEIKY